MRAQPAEARTRYVYRHPAQTLEFFGVEPGMTVVEVLPGRGWYSKILLPYLGSEGQLIGADYTWDMLPLFGFYSDARLEAKKTWVDTWPRRAEDWSKRRRRGSRLSRRLRRPSRSRSGANE